MYLYWFLVAYSFSWKKFTELKKQGCFEVSKQRLYGIHMLTRHVSLKINRWNKCKACNIVLPPCCIPRSNIFTKLTWGKIKLIKVFWIVRQNQVIQQQWSVTRLYYNLIVKSLIGWHIFGIYRWHGSLNAKNFPNSSL